MQPRLGMLLAIIVGGMISACGPKLSKEQYIAVMSDLGCHMLSEGDRGVDAIYRQHGVTQADITAFRGAMKKAIIPEVATTIARKVAACHGVGTTGN